MQGPHLHSDIAAHSEKLEDVKNHLKENQPVTEVLQMLQATTTGSFFIFMTWFFSPRSPMQKFPFPSIETKQPLDNTSCQSQWRSGVSQALFDEFVTAGCSCRSNFSWFKVQLHSSGMVLAGWADAHRATLWQNEPWICHLIFQIVLHLVHSYMNGAIPCPFHMIAERQWDSFGWDPDAPAFRLSCPCRRHLQYTADAPVLGPDHHLLPTARPGRRGNLFPAQAAAQV